MFLAWQELCPDWENDKAVLSWADGDQSSLKAYLAGVTRYFYVFLYIFLSREPGPICLYVFMPDATIGSVFIVVRDDVLLASTAVSCRVTITRVLLVASKPACSMYFR